MIRSMTGYARSETQGPWGRLAWELRSVNHRYLELQFRMPEEFRGLENELRTRAQARIGRGKVEASLRYQTDVNTTSVVEIDSDRLQAVLAAAQAIATRADVPLNADAMRLLAWPGVVRQQSTDFAPMIAAAQQLFDQALTEFSAARAREGERLLSYLEERAESLKTLAARVRERAPQVRGAWLERLQTKLRELAVEIDPARLAQEAAISAQRLDVDEELSRLLSHLVELREALRRDESVGRRLDFLMQELNREANTLSSKSQDAEMTRCAVEMKVLIEQMREQVQNIE
jgi:uncharacterized protein (TIGR00255 family)